MKLEEATQKALESVRSFMSQAEGAEAEVLSAFSEEFGTEVDGWDMRLEELE